MESSFNERYSLVSLGIFFLKWQFPFLYMLRLFQDSFIFGEANSSHFFRVTISTQELLFASSYIFRAAAFLWSFFSRTVTSLQQFFFENSFFSEQYIKKSYFFKAGTFTQYQLFQKSYFLKNTIF